MQQFLTKSNDDDDDSGSSLVGQVLGAVMVLAIASIVNAVYDMNVYIFDMFGELFWRGVSFEALTNLWWIPIWAFGINVLFILWQRHQHGNRIFSKSPGKVMKQGVAIAAVAGVLEELIFRWFFYLSTIATIAFGNLILCGLPEWIYTNIVLVLANYGTAQLLTDLLITHPEGWLVGAAIVSASAAFRGHHAYQGFFGWVDSWFFSMAMFFVLFNYGLLACILAHFTFNLCAAATLACMTMLFTDH